MPVMEIRKLFRLALCVSLPFTYRGPPLVTKEPMSARLIDLANRAREYANIARLEVHSDLPGEEIHRQGRGVAHVLPLSRDPELTFRRFSRSQVQRSVRKAERDGLTLRRAETADELIDSFYGLHLRTRGRLGVPVQPRRFFD